MMIPEQMQRDMAKDPDAMFGDVETTPDGHKVFKELYFGAPSGYRPLTMRLYVPAGSGPHPVVVDIHGGAWQAGHQNIMNPVVAAYQSTEKLLEAGYAVARSSYRLSLEAKFPAQLHDCKAAIRFLRHHAERLDLDQSRIAVMGESSGGHLALMVGLTCNRADLEGDVGVTGESSAVSCVVDWYGPTNILFMHEAKMPNADDPDGPEARLIGGVPGQNQEKARFASPVQYVSADCPPILIEHGTKDTLVSFDHAEQLAKRLDEVGATFVFHPVEGANHCFWGADPDSIMPPTLAFLARNL